MGRTFGFAADHVVSLDVVTTDGGAYRVTTESEPYLYWRMCGSQNDLGVVTSMTVELMPVAILCDGAIPTRSASPAVPMRGRTPRIGRRSIFLTTTIPRAYFASEPVAEYVLCR